jgi:hypothetical protein
MSITYIIVKKLLNESSICCMIFTYVYNKCSILIILDNNHMVSYDIFSLLMYLNHMISAM